MPSVRANMTEATILSEIDRFGAAVKEKAQRLADQAKAEVSSEKRAELKLQSQRLVQLDGDIQKSRTFTDKTIKELPNPDFDRQLQAFRSTFDAQARFKINGLLRGGNLDFVALKMGDDKRSDLFYDKAYSTLNLKVNGQRFTATNLDARVARLVEQSFSDVKGKMDDRYMRAKRYLVSGDGQKTVRNAALNTMMFKSATPEGLYGLIGETPPESATVSNSSGKPARFQDSRSRDSGRSNGNGAERGSQSPPPPPGATLPARRTRWYPS